MNHMKKQDPIIQLVIFSLYFRNIVKPYNVFKHKFHSVLQTCYTWRLNVSHVEFKLFKVPGRLISRWNLAAKTKEIGDVELYFIFMFCLQESKMNVKIVAVLFYLNAIVRLDVSSEVHMSCKKTACVYIKRHYTYKVHRFKTIKTFSN